MLSRTLEPEVMDTAEEARDYDAMDHAAVNRAFVDDFLTFYATAPQGPILDVGTGTAQIPIELCRRQLTCQLTAIDLADHMLAVGRENVRRAGLQAQLRLERWNAKEMPCADDTFAAVISNSIVHHIPEPIAVFVEMVRVVRSGGVLFVRDLLRPDEDATLRWLVDRYATGANTHQRKMFADSLHAALSLAEVQSLVTTLGFPAATVRQTTDRHWTWAARKPENADS
jgi:ubiquinone/menaquinone biosynthesis C-methylase UbiE